VQPSSCPSPQKSCRNGEVATLLFDTGMRPDELHRMEWEYITWTNGEEKPKNTLLALIPHVQEIGVACGRDIAFAFVDGAIQRGPHIFLAFL
jgi:hypothetical protein